MKIYRHAKREREKEKDEKISNKKKRKTHTKIKKMSKKGRGNKLEERWEYTNTQEDKCRVGKKRLREKYDNRK